MTTNKDAMLSIRFNAEELARVRAASEAEGLTLSRFIRRAVKALVPRPELNIDSGYVPSYPGMQSPGHHHFCRSCGMTTQGPSDPMYSGHLGECPEWEKIREYTVFANE